VKGVDISIPAKWDAVSFVICCLVVVFGGDYRLGVGSEVLVVVWMWVICKFNLS